MREQPDLTDRFEEALENHGYSSADLYEIYSKPVESDKYQGVEYKFYGTWVPIRPIIDVVANREDFAIESAAFINESTKDNDLEPHLNVFVADLRRQKPHPAFTQ